MMINIKILLLVITAMLGIGAVSGYMVASQPKSSPEPSPVSEIKEVVTTPEPTKSPVVESKPIVVKATTNPYFSQRLKEIDSRLEELASHKNKLSQACQNIASQDAAPIDLVNSICDNARAKIAIFQDEINSLNTEKTAIMLKI